MALEVFAPDIQVRHYCPEFQPGLPDNSYSFCRHATLWIDWEGGRTCTLQICSHAGVRGLYCHKI